MTFYLLVDVDQFLIVRSLMIVGKDIYDAQRLFNYLTNTDEQICIGSSEWNFIPLSINNMLNLVEINLGCTNIKFLNISANLVTKLESLYVSNCANKHGLVFRIHEKCRNKYIPNYVISINNFFGA